MKSMARRNCLKEILECVDRGLGRLGPNIRTAIYFKIAVQSKLKRAEIVSDPERFVRGLEIIFGPGSRIVEKFIIDELCSTFMITGKTLPDAIKQAKQELLVQAQTATP